MNSDRLIADLTDMFLAKWGFGEPPPAYRADWERDLQTLAWATAIDFNPPLSAHNRNESV